MHIKVSSPPLLLSFVEFLVLNSIHWKKCDAFNIGDLVEYDVICRRPLTILP